MKFLKATATVAGFTALSRVAGFVRDILTATMLGAGPLADAFFVALKLPNFFRRVTAEGAFSVSFIPLYTETLEKDGDDPANDFASTVMSVMVLLLGLFTVLAVLAMPVVIRLIAPGFADGSEQFEAAVALSRITFPYLLLMSVAALFGGVLNAHHYFAPFAAAPVLFNISLISALLLSDYMFPSAAHALAYGVCFSGFLQCGMLYYFVRKYKYKLVLKRPRFTERIKKLFKLMGPGVLGAGVVHINLFIDMIIASMLGAGAISSLYYADRLNQLPLGIVGIAMGTTLLPMLTKALASDKDGEAENLFNRALELCLILTVPAAAGLFMLSVPIISLLFQHGAYTADAALLSASALSFYTLGLPAFVLIKVYSSAFWAQQDTATPVKISIVSTAVNVALSLFLIFVLDFGVTGIALATATAGWVQLTGLMIVLHRRQKVNFDARLKRSAIAVFAGAAVMVCALYVLKQYIGSAYDFGRLFNTFMLIGSGGAVFAALFLPLSGIKPHNITSLIKGR
jgi:putative peptidoglycan lipid II flippase